MLMQADQATLLVIDIQEKLVPAIADAQGLVARSRWLLGVAAQLQLPTVFSEQYPQGLGHTLPELTALLPAAPVVEKVHFSCTAADCLPTQLLERPQVIVCGMETHICVLQTVLGLLAAGKQVFVVVDACGSRSDANHQLGLERMRQAGAQIVSREMVLFELLGNARHEQFRAISKAFLVGEQP